MMNTMMNAREANAMANGYLMTQVDTYIETKIAPLLKVYAEYGRFHMTHLIRENVDINIDMLVGRLEGFGYNVERETVYSTCLKIKWDDVAAEEISIEKEQYLYRMLVVFTLPDGEITREVFVEATSEERAIEIVEEDLIAEGWTRDEFFVGHICECDTYYIGYDD